MDNEGPMEGAFIVDLHAAGIPPKDVYCRRAVGDCQYAAEPNRETHSSSHCQPRQHSVSLCQEGANGFLLWSNPAEACGLVRPW